MVRLTLVACCLLLMTACKKDNQHTNAPALTLTPDNITGKSGRNVQATLTIDAPDGIKELRITKGINLQPDVYYGTDGIVIADPITTGDHTWEYHFTYTLDPDEVEKLVGFNFRLEDQAGYVSEKDLTVNTNASGAQIIATRGWSLRSKLFESATPAIEDIQDCEKDNIMRWNRDSTIAISYGVNACAFDGLNIFDKWTLSEDEKTFTQVYHALFNPTNITTEVFTIRTLTKDKLVMAITYDLSAWGPPFTGNDVYVFTYDAVL